MKKEGLKPSKFSSKIDYHTKKIFINSQEEISKFVEKKFLNKKKKVEKFFKLNQYKNWWEEIGYMGKGKRKQMENKNIQKEILDYKEDNK